MTKQEVIDKINEIIKKDESLKDAKVIINFIDKKKKKS